MSFTDLKVWQEGHNLVLLVYKATKKFPKEERYSLVNQMRRSSASVTANIAEGFGRESYKDRVRFYYIARGSLTELKDQLLISRDVLYLDQSDFQELANKANEVHRLLNAFIKKTKSFCE